MYKKNIIEIIKISCNLFLIFILLLVLNSPLLSKSINREKFKEILNSLIVDGPFLRKSNIELKRLSDVVSYQELGKELIPSPLLSENFFDANEYAMKYDFDNDGINELILLQLNGSAQFPDFMICKYDSQLKKYKQVIQSGRLIYPILIQKKIYFFEKDYNFHSGRLTAINLMKVNKKIEIKKIYSFSVNYLYNIPEEFKDFLNDEILEKSSNFDFSYLKQDDIIKKDNSSYSYIYKEFTVKVEIIYTTVGHITSYINLDLFNRTKKYHLLFKDILGFNFVKVSDQYVLVTTQTNNISAYTAIIANKIILSNLEDIHSAQLFPQMIIE